MSIFGGVDMYNIEVVDLTKVIGDSSKGGASCFGYTVVDDDHIIISTASEFNLQTKKGQLKFKDNGKPKASQN